VFQRQLAARGRDPGHHADRWHNGVVQMVCVGSAVVHMAFIPGPFRIARRMALARPKSHIIRRASKADVAANYAHATGEQCPRCGHPIEASQVARRVGDGDWVHDMCPLASGAARPGTAGD